MEMDALAQTSAEKCQISKQCPLLAFNENRYRPSISGHSPECYLCARYTIEVCDDENVEKCQISKCCATCLEINECSVE